jgi:large subunit ribosomal protein L22
MGEGINANQGKMEKQGGNIMYTSKKPAVKKDDIESKTDVKKEEKQTEVKEMQGQKTENEEIKPETKKEKPKIKGQDAKVIGRDIPISTKQSVAICDMIRGQRPSRMIEKLELVLKKKMAVPMKGEIPHRHNMPKGKVSGRYPQNASREFIKMLKNLIANAGIKNIGSDELIITLAKADKASEPYRGTRMAFGRKFFKRSNILIEAKTIKKEKQLKNEKKMERKK